MKIISIITLSFLFACSTGAPKMERPIMVWNGSPENAGICKIKTEAVQKLMELNPEYFDAPGLSKPTTCLKATEKTFQEYAGIKFVDVQVIQNYIEVLKNSCMVWK